MDLEMSPTRVYLFSSLDILFPITTEKIMIYYRSRISIDANRQQSLSMLVTILPTTQLVLLCHQNQNIHEP